MKIKSKSYICTLVLKTITDSMSSMLIQLQGKLLHILLNCDFLLYLPLKRYMCILFLTDRN